MKLPSSGSIHPIGPTKRLAWYSRRMTILRSLLVLYLVTQLLFWDFHRHLFPSEAEHKLQRPSKRGGVFICGWEYREVANHLFPDYTTQFVERYAQNVSMQTENDILVFGLHGRCNNIGPRYVRDYFPGKALFVNGENYGSPTTTMASDRIFQIGMVPDTRNTVRVFFGALQFVNHYRTHVSSVFNHSQKPMSSKKYHAVIYLQGHCVPFREEVAGHISTVVPLHYGGRCQGSPISGGNISAAPESAKGVSTIDYYHNYKFCMVMENKNKVGYISEKVFFAFLGGCVPIYFGTPEIFEIFNKQSFVYYDIAKPEQALAQIDYLTRNETAYDEVMRQPILSDGNRTINDYFSIGEQFGNGALKKKIRNIMDLD